MRERLLLLIPVAGFSCLLVLFMVFWQAIQHQNNRLQNLTNRLKDLEQREEVNSRQLLEQQLGVLKTRQEKLQIEIKSLQTLQNDSAKREARLLDMLRKNAALPSTPEGGTGDAPAIPTPVTTDPSALNP
ncbi:MAG: signal protein [Synechococcus sp.]|uniref:signal protein n=1 Tax=Synechococcus sp. BMK-MC-1 TaxID=1442551 RepID=UPI001644B59B|nr:signal protein [Synechococcus sp. BMK-MC-1]QNI67946.1 putative hAMP domain protein [Synechococcus sp. BMK-MC-1]